MKKYENIYVPDPNGDFKLQEFYEDYHEWTDVISAGSLSEQSNVIVLTIEELREMWKAAWDEGYNDSSISEGRPNIEPAPDFKSWMESKGIKITTQ